MNSMRVLYVEDNPVDADLTRRYLAKQAPHIVLTLVTSLAEARNYLQSAQFDVALIDLRLQDGLGFDLLGMIRRQNLPMAVVMLTGSGDQRAAVVALQAGADDYLTKSAEALEQLPIKLAQACANFQKSRGGSNHVLRVLYAEHHAADIDLTRRHLTRFAPHIQLTVVDDAVAVLKSLPKHGNEVAEYDVVMLDYRLPGLDALEVVKVLRAERELDIPIVIVSGQGNELVSTHAIHLGVDDYIVKHAGYLHELPATLEKVRRQVDLARERIRLRETSERLEHVLASSPVILYTLCIRGGIVSLHWVSSNIHKLLGYSEAEAKQPNWWLDHVHPDDRAAALNQLQALSAGEKQIQDYRFHDRLGGVHWIRDEMRLVEFASGHLPEINGVWQDVTESRLAEQLRETRVAVLDGLMSSRPLNSILTEIAERLEALHPDMRVSVLISSPRTGVLKTGAAPSLPDFFSRAVDGLEPQVGKGSCGTSAATGEMVIVEDVQTHPYWAAYTELTERAGVRACWSIPFKDITGQVLGTFGIYYAQPRSPQQSELDLIGEFARMAGLAVERGRANASLRQAAAVFESTREGVVVTDLNPHIVGINPAYTAITGYTEDDVLGRDPSLLQSGREDAAFFQAMWKSIHESGHWQGEIWNRRKTGELFPQLLTINTVFDGEGKPINYVGVMTDISQLKDSEARLAHLAHYDPLTHLPNRLLLQSRLKHALESAERHGRKVAVLYIDLDRFKNVNDSLGHPVGDELLEALSARLQTRLREEDTLGRFGGDEFLLILEDLKRHEHAADVAKELIGMLEESFSLPSGHEVYVGASIGISLFPDDGASGTELIQHADVALYQAKEIGRNTFSFYTPGLTQAADERLAMEARLRRALAQGEFILHYQPLVDFNTGQIVGCEALVRWQDPQEGLVSPDRFISLAEDTGLIVPLGEWVLHQACVQARSWLDAGLPPLLLAVNLSARQLRQTDLVSRVAMVLQKTGLPPAQLKLELTESMIMGHGEEVVALLQDLKQLGLSLSIDDFGTGYSSLAYLKRFPIDELKIDRSFVRDIPHDSSDMEIAAAIIGLAHSLRLKVVAEGVETEEQRRFLEQHGCHAYQGFLFSRPVSAEAFAALIKGMNQT